MGLASGILAALAALSAWAFPTQEGVFTQVKTLLAGFSATGGLSSMSALLNGEDLWGVCAMVGLLTMLGCTLLGRLGALACIIVATGSAGALLIGFSTHHHSTRAPAPKNNGDSNSQHVPSSGRSSWPVVGCWYDAGRQFGLG